MSQLYDITKLERISTFAARFPKANGETGVSHQFIHKLIRKYDCNFQLVIIDGMNFIYCPHPVPTYKSRCK